MAIPYKAITKQNLTEVLAQTGRINNSDKYAAEGLLEIVGGIASRLYASTAQVSAEVQAGYITKDTYISFDLGFLIDVDTAENILKKY